MLKERIQEIFEFTKSESPYRKANKGWINQDVYLDLTPSVGSDKQKNEDAKITLFWSPINSLLSNIFLIIILCSILVFTSISFAKGRFDLDFFKNSSTIDFVKFEENKVPNSYSLMDKDSTKSNITESVDTKDFDKSKSMNSSDDNLIQVDKKIINEKTDNQKDLIKENKSKKDIKILQTKKPKSNFF